ncbi:MAG: hypothetical protein RL431_446 [Actinomycetota bacterium]|jgi:hypothetical protein
MEKTTVKRKVNPLAVLSLVLGCMLSPMALPLGWFATEQIRRTHEGGRRMAVAAIVLGWVNMTLWMVGGVLLWLWWVEL